MTLTKKAEALSIISEHQLFHNYTFIWDEIQILDIESAYQKRFISEMIFIGTEKLDLNKQNDIELLPDSYFTIPLLNPSHYPFLSPSSQSKTLSTNSPTPSPFFGSNNPEFIVLRIHVSFLILRNSHISLQQSQVFS